RMCRRSSSSSRTACCSRTWEVPRRRRARRWATCRSRTCACTSPASRSGRASPDALGRFDGRRLQPVLQAQLVGELDLRFQPVDVLLLALEDVLQQPARDVVAHLLAMRDGLLERRVGDALLVEIALQRLEGVLPDQELAEVLQVGEAFQEEDPLDEAVGMLHFVDRLL